MQGCVEPCERGSHITAQIGNHAEPGALITRGITIGVDHQSFNLRRQPGNDPVKNGFAVDLYERLLNPTHARGLSASDNGTGDGHAWA